MSGIVHKIKEAVHPDSKSHNNTVAEGSHGPYDSRGVNAVNPRVDSDRDGRGTGRTAGQGEYGGVGCDARADEGTHGPYSSRVANAADPRVDSAQDNSRTLGAGRTAGHGEYSSTGYPGTGASEGAYGPHNSRVANAADPRVDSDLDNSRTIGTGATGLGARTTGGYGSSAAGATGTHGPHSSRVTNVVGSRVDSGRDGRGALSTGPGPALNTAGPHSSDMANKMDPRVDSDRDGSRTMGGNKTYQ
ncbi:hypothetical protein VTH06DRAFT_2843 [Thermothelomyces fergusii]